MIATLIILALFWKPILWAGQAAYHAATDSVEVKATTPDYMGQVRAWFVKLWELIGPGLWRSQP